MACWFPPLVTSSFFRRSREKMHAVGCENAKNGTSCVGLKIKTLADVLQSRLTSMTSYSRPCVSEREEGIAGTNQSQCNPSSSPSAGLGPNATRWFTRQSRKRAKSSYGAGATSLIRPLLRRQDISRIRPCWAPPLPPAVGPSSWGPTARSMGSTPRRGDFTGSREEAPAARLHPGARVVASIWN